MVFVPLRASMGEPGATSPVQHLVCVNYMFTELPVGIIKTSPFMALLNGRRMRLRCPKMI